VSATRIAVMDQSSLRAILPYVLGLAVAAALYVYAGQIDYTPREGELGPAVWPRLAIILMGASCAFEIVRKLAGSRAEARGIAEMLDRETGTDGEKKYPLLLIGGMVLVSAYAVVVPLLGFILSTFIFLAAFMYLGRYRNHRAVWATSAVVTVLCGVLFLRVAYVSLPRGMAPFDRVTDAFLLIPRL
jgi:putative tricarboxylic transport membrane protein